MKIKKNKNIYILPSPPGLLLGLRYLVALESLETWQNNAFRAFKFHLSTTAFNFQLRSHLNKEFGASTCSIGTHWHRKVPSLEKTSIQTVAMSEVRREALC